MSPRVVPNKEENYVVYYRASTERQRDGLGLEAQKTAINNFIDRFGGNVLEEVEEIVSGGSLTRAGFERALNIAKDNDATLLVHKIDRLSRSGYVTMAQLEESDTPFIEAGSPNDSNFSKGIKFLVAKEERDKTRTRVKDSLGEINSAIKEKGFHISKAGNKITSLGNPENLTQEGRDKSIETRRKKALDNTNNIRAYSVVKLLLEEGTYSLRGIARYLNDNEFKTSTGKDFTNTSVTNLIKLYK